MYKGAGYFGRLKQRRVIMKTEIELLRKIAEAAKNLWDHGGLRVEDTHLKNLLTDYIDFVERAENES
jgi:hypothetical protein